MKSIRKILLMQPNYGILGKRTWEMPPYGLAILNACLADRYQVELYDPNFTQATEAEIRSYIAVFEPDVVGITSFSTEYIEEVSFHAKLVREVRPDCCIVIGGAFPTVMPEKAIADPNVDFCILGEGEKSFPALLSLLEERNANYDAIDGVAFKNNGVAVISPAKVFIESLDLVPFPDYGNLNLTDYGNFRFKYAHYLVPRQFPFAMTITSRGCPFDCIFCAAKTVSGTKVRLRSAENVLQEIDMLCAKYGMKEIVFLDDHFLHNQQRARLIAEGIRSRNYGLTWKCSNVAVFSLNDDLLEVMKNSGCYQLTLSLESGSQEVLKNIIRKPVDLKKSREIIRNAKKLGYEIISNFVIGFPGETWDQIRQTVDFAQSLDIDLVNFHIATPMPKTRLMDICIKEGFLDSEDDLISGYTKGIISTSEFSSMDLQILRAYEWDRINFSSPEKSCKIAQIEGIALQEVADWRKNTRRSLGTTMNWKERSSGQN